jgi:hypothetical protein
MSDSDDADDPQDEAQPEDTQIDQIEATDAADEEFHPFDELDEDFRPSPAVHVMGADGGPIALDQTSESHIPPLSTKTLVCMGDYSKFVLRNRFWVVVASFDPSEVTRQPNGKWTVPLALAIERTKLTLERERERMAKLEVKRHGPLNPFVGAAKEQSEHQMLANAITEGPHPVLVDPEHVAVEPIRPPCKHYVRQRTSWHMNPEHQFYARLCSARRTTEGTFMTVRDTGMWACDMRDPYDAESIKDLEAFDAMKIDQGAKREYLPIISPLPSGGLFSPKPGDASIFSIPKEN